jgi:drug/metabolite transporter (DMT)-like permease
MFSKERRAEIFLLSLTIIWGSTFVVVKDSLSAVSPMLYVALRFSLASVMFAAFFYKRIFPIERTLFRQALPVAVLLFIGFAFQTLGLKYTTASKSGFITGLYVIITPFVQSVMEKKMPGRNVWIGTAAVSVGLFLLTSPTAEIAESGFNIGDFFTLLCAASFSFYMVQLDMLTATNDSASDREPQNGLTFKITFIQLGVTAVLAALASPLVETLHAEPSIKLGSLLLYMALMATVLTTLLQTRFQKEVSPSRAAIIFSMESVFAAVFAFLFLNERLSSSALAGTILIVLGLIIAESKSQQDSASVPETLK